MVPSPAWRAAQRATAPPQPTRKPSRKSFLRERPTRRPAHHFADSQQGRWTADRRLRIGGNSLCARRSRRPLKSGRLP